MSLWESPFGFRSRVYSVYNCKLTTAGLIFHGLASIEADETGLRSPETVAD